MAKEEGIPTYAAANKTKITFSILFFDFYFLGMSSKYSDCFHYIYALNAFSVNKKWYHKIIFPIT